MSFKEIRPDEISGNIIKAIRDEYMLICVGDENEHNMMTASWGFFGEMWGKDCVTIAVRNTRHTYKFTENSDTFALCFMGDKYKSVHKVCGSLSGRDVDKVQLTGLNPVFDNDTMYFEEARLVVICKKIYSDTIKPQNFTKPDYDKKWYAAKDYHTMYCGEIIKVFERT